MIVEKRLVLPTISVLLLLINVGSVYASLIDDEVHFKITNGGITCEGDVIVGPNVEIPSCGGFSIDFDGNSIWFESQSSLPHGSLVPDTITYEFTNLDWTNDPSGIITGVQLINPMTIPLNNPAFGDHSITLVSDPFTVQCPGGSGTSCILEWHLNLEHSSSGGQTIGGEIIPIESTSLLLAGVQTSAAWLIPVVLTAAGVGFVLVRRK